MLELRINNVNKMPSQNNEKGKSIIARKLFRESIIKDLVADWKNQKKSMNTEKKRVHKKRECFLQFIPNQKKDCAICSNSKKNKEIQNSMLDVLGKYERLKKTDFHLEKFGEKRKRTSFICSICQIPMCCFPCYDIHKFLLVSKNKKENFSN
jgi:hypothetical protein